MNSPRHFALIPAAGVGARMGSSSPKQYVPIAGKPMLLHVLDTFAASKIITHTFVVVSAEDTNIRDMMAGAPHLQERVTIIFNGGATRHVSVLKGLRVLSDHAAADDWVLVHDAAALKARTLESWMTARASRIGRHCRQRAKARSRPGCRARNNSGNARK